jgi:hypothetical protein
MISSHDSSMIDDLLFDPTTLKPKHSQAEVAVQRAPHMPSERDEETANAHAAQEAEEGQQVLNLKE